MENDKFPAQISKRDVFALQGFQIEGRGGFADLGCGASPVKPLAGTAMRSSRSKRTA
jgi:hypothetical protein